jgi:hypothetical protein
MRPYVQAWFDRLDEAIRKARRLSIGNQELEGILASHLAVLISGAYEDCIEQLIVERASRGGDESVRNYAQSTIDILFRNPNSANIQRALKLFGEPCAVEFKRRIGLNASEAINSIVTNKNNVAHGRTCNVTLGDIEDYFTRSVPVFEILEDILDAV